MIRRDRWVLGFRSGVVGMRSRKAASFLVVLSAFFWTVALAGPAPASTKNGETVPIPASAIKRHGQSITYAMTNAPTPDFFVFLGDHSVPGTVSFSVTWTANGGVRNIRPGSSDPTDPTNLQAEFRDALPTATFS